MVKQTHCLFLLSYDKTNLLNKLSSYFKDVQLDFILYYPSVLHIPNNSLFNVFVHIFKERFIN